MILLQACASSRGPAYGALQLANAHEIQLLLSEEILAELTEVLERSEMRARFHSLTKKRLTEFLQYPRETGELIKAIPHVIHLERDPDDEPYLNLALAGQAHVLVTWDKDLLDLENQSSTVGAILRKMSPSLRILAPDSFLAAMRRPT